MATTFSLNPNPTFKVDVNIPRAGEEEGVLTFTFKHKPLNELSSLEQHDSMTGLDFLMDIVAGWALPEEFTRENLDVLVNNYPKALEAVTRCYYSEILGSREKK
jgi:hypothetical protein